MSHSVEIIGVRHHSPACARLVARRIQDSRPAWVLIEGPADFNSRLDELFLAHTLPLAIYSFCSASSQLHRASWSPFAEYSPEWQALHTGRACGARLAFIDLPAWHDAFAGISNRYADISDSEQEQLACSYEAKLSQQLGIEGRDALWDHLFEAAESEDLATHLSQYFIHLRGDDPGSGSNQAREEMMARWIAWAAQHGSVLVVCGGYHAPALAKRWPLLTGFSPASPPPGIPSLAECIEERPEQDITTGSYLLPYTSKRLDAFHGYASGMPSPAFQQAVWDQGLLQAGNTLLQTIMQRLRHKKLPASTADLQAVHLRTQALARLRGHETPLRHDYLDALAGSLVRDALDAPLPWTYRGPLRKGTDPVLVEMMDVLAGDQTGQLAKNTPLPALYHAVQNELNQMQLQTSAVITLALLDPPDRQKSRVLHRLAILQIPGFKRISGPNWAMSGERTEQWQLSAPLEQQAALIEAAIYGATLQDAAIGRMEEQLATSTGTQDLARLLNRAAQAGLAHFSQGLLRQLQTAICAESRFEALGQPLAICHGLYRHGSELDMADAPALLDLLHITLDRLLWLAEAHGSVTAQDFNAHLAAWQALRLLLRDAKASIGQPLGELPVTRTLAVCERKARHPQAAAVSRGAALGCLLSVGHEQNASEIHAAITLLAGLPANALGDALQGLLALARHELIDAEGFISTLNQLICQFDDEDFVQALPALRAAFAWLPSLERGHLARQILQLHHSPLSQSSLTAVPCNIAPELFAANQQKEKQAISKLQQWGCISMHPIDGQRSLND
ncbi:hypothetical protein HA050_01275 [Iodobacter sp. HSC-16F04]|uniref:Uncharacterized protein n=1 Tax=Iodobacter violaceini TaxID=3044271 RepID=A0ABX0KRU3_9NEIS|nr:DUF5682 family protein [Iodobacter violacea]NHQ84749.1 hypothetical protein [Iodobacter violacea]